MPIHLSKITLNKLGPLGTNSYDLGSLNLFYGKNETGKTFLVEFLLQSIFRQASSWDLRDIPGKGSVTIEGLQEKPVNFTLSAGKKIEDFWEEKVLGLPLNMARLLVVKGGELDFSAGTPGGVSRVDLISALTSKELLDQIKSGIKPTIQKAKIIKQEIQGANRPPLKNQRELRAQIQKLGFIQDQIEKTYSRGPIHQIEIQLNQIQEALEYQEQAKGYYAYQLRQDQANLISQRNNLPGETLENLRDNIRDYQRLLITIKSQEKILAENQKTSEDFLWLKSSLEIWESRNLETAQKPPLWISVLGGVFLLVGALALGLLNLTLPFSLLWLGIPSLLIGLGFFTYYIIQLQRWADLIHDSQERQSIKEEYQSRFKKTVRGVAGLRTQKESLEGRYYQVKIAGDELTKKLIQQREDSDQIMSQFQALTGELVQEMNWENAYQTLKTESEQITQNLVELNVIIESLKLADDQISHEPGPVEFNPQEIIDLKNTQASLQVELSGLEQSLEILKQQICTETGDDITKPWEKILTNFRNLVQDKEKEYRNSTARIIAEIGVVHVIDQIQKEEDQKIQNDLNAPEVTDLLLSITGSYNKIELVDDLVFISDPYNRYSMQNLSTGAKEQIQLALRLGIASKITGGTPLFIILDDAFQHSDWSRREDLVKQVILLVKKRWQMTYLTMDDHIRDLFLKYGKAAIKKQFTYHELQ